MMRTAVELILEKLPDAKRSADGYAARCPAHEDRRASLSVAEGDNGGAVLHCHAGCETSDVLAAVGLTMADLRPTDCKAIPNGKPRDGDRHIVATYDYRDECGNLLFQVVRFEPKDFRQRRPDGKGGWTWSVKGVRVVPYRLREIVADPTRPVFVVEGEKDCDNLARLGVLATCNAGGAGKWTAEHAEYLRGRVVIVLADNDEAGRNQSQQVAQLMHGIGSSVRLVELPGLSPKGDVSDWILGQPDARDLVDIRAELEHLAEVAPPWAPPPVVEPGPILTCLADVKAVSVPWLWAGRIPLGRITLLVGRPGEGKSFLTIDAAARVTSGTPWPDGSECPQGSVILISAEDDPADTIRPRLDAHCADVRRVHLLSAVRRIDRGGHYEQMITLADLDAIEASLVKLADCKLIVVDPIGSFLGGGTDSHRDNEVRAVLAPIAKLAEKYGPAVLVVAHRRKGTGIIADDLALGSRAFTGVARAVWHLVRDQDDNSRRLLLPGKNNLAREGDGLAFSILGEPPRVDWEPEPVPMSADDAMSAEGQIRDQRPGPDAEALEAAKAWLLSSLSDGPRPAKELQEEWREGESGSKRTLDRAKRALGIKADRPKVPGPWWWHLPANSANPDEHE